VLGGAAARHDHLPPAGNHRADTGRDESTDGLAENDEGLQDWEELGDEPTCDPNDFAEEDEEEDHGDEHDDEQNEYE
jgi:hypothetical protein